MRWEESVFAVFDDLEQQAEGLALVERDVEVADLSVAEYSRVTLGSRLHASMGQDLRVRLASGQVLGGRLARMGENWVLLVEGGAEWIVRCAAVVTIAGLSPRAHHEDTWSVVDRLSLRAVLRQVAASREPCVVHLVGDQQVEGRLGRVGRDFVEITVGTGADRSLQATPVTSILALQARST